MKDLLADLIALQDVELEIFKAEEGLRELPKDISEIESIMNARRKSLDAVDEEISSYEIFQIIHQRQKLSITFYIFFFRVYCISKCPFLFLGNCYCHTDNNYRIIWLRPR